MNILGLGGHAKVVIDVADSLGYEISAVYDDDEKRHGSKFCGFLVKGKIENGSISGDAIIAIGNNKVRKEIDQRLSTRTVWKKVIHPASIIAKGVEVGEGTVIMAGAIIQPGTKIGRHCIINTGACIDHDCKIADFSHIAPNSGIAGGVTIGEGAFIGIGTSITQYLEVGKWTKVGAGSVIINNIPSNCTAVGIPAKPIKYNNE